MSGELREALLYAVDHVTYIGTEDLYYIEPKAWHRLADAVNVAAAPRTEGPDHPHDGYAYDGCDCVCCVNVRALAR